MRGRKNVKEKKPYSIVSAAKYILMISLMLYWLPILGQMIAGFIGGRRAGSPWRAIMAALLPVFLLYLFSLSLSTGLIPIKIQEAAMLTYAGIKRLLDALPVASSYINFATTYVGSFVSELNAAASFKAGNYLITIAFAYVGGILSDQSRRELEYVSRSSAPTTNIMVGGNGTMGSDENIVQAVPQSRMHLFTRQRTPAYSSFATMRPVLPRGMVETGDAVTGTSGQEHNMYTVKHTAERNAEPRSWEDVYLSNMRKAGIDAGDARLQFRRGSMGGSSTENEDDERAFVARQSVAYPSRNNMNKEYTRRLVERALGKDAASYGYRKAQKTDSAAGANSFAAEDSKSRTQWELL